MILIVSSLGREAEALAALCAQRAWPSQTCSTVSQFRRVVEKIRPKLVIVRQRLTDGYSDDVLTHLGNGREPGPARVIVLAPADCSSKEETRHVSLGADSVFRDPVRVEVLLEMVARYRARPATPASPSPVPTLCYEFAGVQVFPHEHRLSRSGQDVRTTPRVIGLVQILHHAAGQVVPYATLYPELFERRFDGDTSNCRVLLAKADSAFRRLGVKLREHIKVIPKSGYLYQADNAAR
jgi:DNA-binding response OmpR family regulator